MATKKQSHTGFRNGDLFCFHCGQSYHVEMPQPVDMYTAILKQFDKSHKSCVKTWNEPIADSNGKTVEQNADWWLVNGERGMSSETMFYYFTGRRIGRYETTPSDPDDFKRCYKLLQAVPQWKNELEKLRKGGDVWSKLVDNWDKLTEMYEQNVREDWKNYKKIGMYEFMKSLGC